MRLAIALVLLAGLASRTAATELSAPERTMVRSIDAGLPRGLELLERTVNLNSGTMNFEGVREVGALFRAEYDRLGFRTRWVDGTAWNRAGHLIAERRGRSARLKVLLIGHLDTVFEKDSPFQRFERLDDSTARGPGTTDMKGGDVVMLLALRALADARRLDKLDVTVVLTGDEEKSGDPLDRARADLRAAARGVDVAIGFEDGAGDPRTAVVARRSSMGWTVRTSGVSSHSSQIFRPDVGSGAIYEAARILTAFHDSLGGEPYLTFNPGVILGGTSVGFDSERNRGSAFGKSNVVAESTVVAGDLRTLTPDQLERTRSAMERIVAGHLPRTDAAIEFDDGYPPLAPSDASRRLLGAFDHASRDLGFGPVTEVDPARAGAADISFTAGLAKATLDGVGMMGRGGHTVEETTDLRTLAIQAKRAAVTLSRLADGRR